ncbi:MAG: methionyl-tRNA formyltransferase, partial [Clostridia bacterium]|nr:methionyl-tRNA formyltransferase [Clostridia bacterium]
MRRVLFAGTPDFALPSLEALVRHGYEVVGVLTQPDKPQTRKMIMTPPPVKVAAEKYGIPVLQFAKVRKEGVEAIRALEPDVIVTAAYGQIISQEIIDIPRLGVINVHGSLLPAYRGACPIQMAMINGDKETGVTIMRTALKVDSGDIILQRSIPIGDDESLESLFDRLAVLGAYALIEALDKVFDGTAVYT